MDIRLFLATFATVFLAELGDKTQLAVMSQSAAADPAARAKFLWTVFAAGALALTVSTALGVLFGGLLNRYVPERYVKLGAGALFIVMGLLLIREGVVAFKAD